MRSDLVNAFRSLQKSPGYALAAILTLALGIGANTAIFSVVNDVLLRDLPYAEPERLVMLWERSVERGHLMNPVSPANFLDWRERSESFSAVAGFFDRTFTLTGEGEPRDVDATGVTPNFFAMLGAKPQLGRLLNADDEKPDSPLAVVLSDKYWRSQFGGLPGVIGRRLTLSGSPATVVGVMPRDFGFYVKEASFNRAPPAFWVQARFDTSHRIRRGRYLAALGQLKPGVTIERAQAEMTAIASTLEQQNPGFNKGWGVNVVPLRAQLSGEIRPALLLVFGAVCLTLFIACANVVNLQLVRASARAREFTVRAALGASRRRLVRFLLLENVVLALLGGAAGLFLGRLGLSSVQRLMPKDLLPADYIGLDGPILAFTVGVSALTGLLFGLVPALAASNPRLADALKDGSRGGTSARGRRIRQVFVTAQVAVALIVLIGSGLLLRSFDRLLSTNVGFDARNLLAARITLPGSSYGDDAKIQAFYEQLLARVKGLPGVLAATGNVFAPFAGPGAGTDFDIVGRPAPAGQAPVTDVRVVAADYFSALRIPLIAGRTFSPEEHARKRGVIIINETLARRHFPDRSPIGEKLVVNMRRPAVPSEIIGVVGDIRHERLDQPAREMVYWPHSELPIGMMTLLVRTEGNPLLLGPSLQREVWAIDRDLPVSEPRTMEQLMAGTVARQRFATLLFGLFATLALLLASLGIYAVVSYKVALETRDIGVRMALGAGRERVLSGVLANGGRLAGVGVVIGLAASLGLTRLLSSQLYEVSATDPLTFLIVPALLMVIAVLSALPAARRAAGVEPMAALREE
ncbi:MAG: ABC transporter permease [Vicinamibacteria bacterium]|nr:ABC transporter permease [Vicinamibacteria bacterium]